MKTLTTQDKKILIQEIKLNIKACERLLTTATQSLEKIEHAIANTKFELRLLKKDLQKLEKTNVINKASNTNISNIEI